MKNSATRMIAISDVRPESGNAPRVENSAAGWLSATASETFAVPESCRLIAAPPRTAN
jgi:hypothetical protein